jgi:dihydroorotate dehydrogenase
MASYYITLGCQLQKKTDDVMPTQEIKYSVPVSKTFISPPVSRALFFIQFINPSIIPIMGSYTLKPRSGLVGQIIRTLRPTWSGWINKIGLRNIGIHKALENHKTGQIVSICCKDNDEWKQMNEIIPKNIDLELNISCPNAKEFGTHTYDEMCHKELSKFLNNERQWCIVKISPTMKEDAIDNLYQIGFRQFHCCNTLPSDQGGISGKELIPYTSEKIKYIHEKYPDSEIIGGGGVYNFETLCKYKKLGAEHISLSTIFFNPLRVGMLCGKIIFNKFKTRLSN